MLFIKAIKMSMSMMHVTHRFSKNELYIQFQKVNVGLFRDYSKSIYQCQAKTFKYRTGQSLFVYIFLQASSGREMDQNKGLRSVL